MAKRKRLTPNPTPAPQRAPETKALANGWAGVRTAPIADVAGASATQAALEEVAGEMTQARREGRLIQRIALDDIDETHLVRDRAFVDEGEMMALLQSLKARGQQTPIEVVALAQGKYGLISGWRRLIALRRLRMETQSSDFTTALCLIRTPQSASEAYLAMVEENEIRAGLSFYERARIAARAAEQGAYPTARYAVKGLFANASAPKRSKIGSFLAIYDALDTALTFPAALSERMGLALSKALEADAALAGAITARLKAKPPKDAQAEQAVLGEMLAPAQGLRPASPAPVAAKPAQDIPQGGLCITRAKGILTLSGPDVTDDLMDALEDWLKTQF